MVNIQLSIPEIMGNDVEVTCQKGRVTICAPRNSPVVNNPKIENVVACVKEGKVVAFVHRP